MVGMVLNLPLSKYDNPELINTLFDEIWANNNMD